MPVNGWIETNFFSREYLGSQGFGAVWIAGLLILGAIHSIVGFSNAASREKMIADEHISVAPLVTQLDALLTVADLHFDGSLPFLRSVVTEKAKNMRDQLSEFDRQIPLLQAERRESDAVTRQASIVDSSLQTMLMLVEFPERASRAENQSTTSSEYLVVSRQLIDELQVLEVETGKLLALVRQSIAVEKDRYRWSLIAILFMLIMMAFVVWKSFFDRVIGPVLRVAESENSAQLQALFHGDSAKISIDRLPDPIARIIKNLSVSFEQYETRINDRTRELIKHTAQLESQAQILREALVEADEGNQAKTRFVAAVSHETRTPLNGIIGLSEILRESELSDEQRKHVELIKRSGEHLSEIINNVLTLSSGSHGEGRIEACDYPGLIHEVLLTRDLSAGESGVETRIEIGDEFPSFVSLPISRVRQILTNLVENAFRYTEKGHITIRAKVEFLGITGRVARLTTEIEDTGRGIAEEDQEKIFNPFVQIKEDDTESREGVGLGLALVKSLCKSIGGTVSVESELGKGSTFSFSVPVNKD